MPHTPDPERYDGRMPFRRCGRSGLVLPAVSLGLWHNFGETTGFADQQERLLRAFDLGITHFDLANNYGPPPGSAEENLGRLLRRDLAGHRDELILSTKAGYVMWPGPYGQMNSSRKYLLASLDQSLQRLGVDYVDIFYSHRFDADTPLEETAGALGSAVRQGKALYVGISSYSVLKTREIAALLRDMGVPCLIHQPNYNLFNRWIEADGLLDALEAEGMGCIGFSPLAQGLLTDKYLHGVPEDARARHSKAFREGFLSDDNLAAVRALNSIAERRGQTLAQMAIAWVLRDPRMTSTIIGASRVDQIEDCVRALDSVEFTDEELAEIDRHSHDGGIDIWRSSVEAGR